MEMIGTVIKNSEIQKMELQAVLESNIIRGSVIYVDGYGNAITNIKKSDFKKIKKNRKFTILFGREDEMITEISLKYSDVPTAEKLAIFGENEQLQIAINKGMASKLLGLKLYEIIRIEFK